MAQYRAIYSIAVEHILKYASTKEVIIKRSKTAGHDGKLPLTTHVHVPREQHFWLQTDASPGTQDSFRVRKIQPIPTSTKDASKGHFY